MKRSPRFLIAIVLALVGPEASAWAEDPAPTNDQLESAKKAYGEGKTLYEQRKYAEAVEKFKESYRLSRNPLLLFNIGHTLDQAGQKDAASFYYRKFLEDAPPDAAQRSEVQKRVEAIEKEALAADPDVTPTPTSAAPTNVEEPKQEITIKPAGTYSANDFQHQLVESAPPGKPLDLTAVVPEDSGFVVALYYRGSADATFSKKPMKWRYKELVGRIPAEQMSGRSVQYYLEVKDQAGTVVTKSGRSTSPNLINVEVGAAPRFFTDLTDDGDQLSVTQIKSRDDADDPLTGKTTQQLDHEDQGKEGGTTEPVKPRNGFRDVGSSRFDQAKWISTGAAGLFVGGAIVTFILAKQQASDLEVDSTSCGTPPCRKFDHDYDLVVQDAGKRYNTLYRVSAALGVASAGVAAYFWYRELTANKTKEREKTWAITPTFADGLTGAAAAARF